LRPLSRDAQDHRSLCPWQGLDRWRISGARPRILWHSRVDLVALLHRHSRSRGRGTQQDSRQVSPVPRGYVDVRGLLQRRRRRCRARCYKVWFNRTIRSRYGGSHHAFPSFSTSKNKFVHLALHKSIVVAVESKGAESVKATLKSGLDIAIAGDNDFYSQRAKVCRDSNAPPCAILTCGRTPRSTARRT
jgi:hypothetical protein